MPAAVRVVSWPAILSRPTPVHWNRRQQCAHMLRCCGTTPTNISNIRPSATDHDQFSRDAASAKRVSREYERYEAPEATEPVHDTSIWRLAELLADMEKLLVVTGAGCSTEFPSVSVFLHQQCLAMLQCTLMSIPDYRSPGGAYSTGYKPMTHQDFVGSELSRRRYWVRCVRCPARCRRVARLGQPWTVITDMAPGGTADRLRHRQDPSWATHPSLPRARTQHTSP
eukprot:scaffold2295_cov354-Prasinococcus_capsulatus_cf.AAC.15